MFQNRYILFLLILVSAGCHEQTFVVTHHAFKNNEVKRDTTKQVLTVADNLIAPYKQRLDSTVKVVVGMTDTILLREKPEGTLNNLSADAVLEAARNQYGKEVQFAVLNYGGLRISSIGKGTITTGKIFELMPFENQVCVLSIPGHKVRQLFDLVAANGGWPISGATCMIHADKADSVRIGGELIQDSSTYYLATSDYLANGGDLANMLQSPIKRIDTDMKIRDVISKFVQSHSPLHYRTEGRIINRK